MGGSYIGELEGEEFTYPDNDQEYNGVEEQDWPTNVDYDRLLKELIEARRNDYADEFFEAVDFPFELINALYIDAGKALGVKPEGNNLPFSETSFGKRYYKLNKNVKPVAYVPASQISEDALKQKEREKEIDQRLSQFISERKQYYDPLFSKLYKEDDRLNKEIANAGRPIPRGLQQEKNKIVTDITILGSQKKKEQDEERKRIEDEIENRTNPPLQSPEPIRPTPQPPELPKFRTNRPKFPPSGGIQNLIPFLRIK